MELGKDFYPSNTWSHELEENKEVKPGQLLLAEPFMSDQNFKRSVTMLCEHNGEDGTLGFILNKPSELLIHEVVEEFPEFNSRVFFGGPVQSDTLHFLHTLGETLGECQQVTEGVYWGGNFETIKLLAQSGELNTHEIRFFLGYAGWSTEQLEEEIQSNSWIINPGSYDDVFVTPPNRLWKETLQTMGGCVPNHE